MIPAGTIGLQPWMAAPETIAVMAALTAAGPARFVGGCVRDARIGRSVGDIDIATPAIPERVIELLGVAGIKAVPTGIAHGTVTAVVAGWHAEITTLRRDVETYGRHAKVAFTDDWEVDAARRDLTINALYCDADGALYDPVGGLADLDAGRVRFVGDAAIRIAEDALRILRFFRFHAWYGRGAPDATGLDACRAAAADLRRLSGERIAGEVLRLLASPHVIEVLEQMMVAGIVAVILPEARGIERLRGLVAIEDSTDPERRLAALISGTADAGAVAARLRLSALQRRRLELLASAPVPLTTTMDRRGMRRGLYRFGRESFVDLTLLAAADGGAIGDWQVLFDAAAAWESPVFTVRGEDALERGIATGPRVGRLIQAVEHWWEEETDYLADRAACLEKLDALIEEETS